MLTMSRSAIAAAILNGRSASRQRPSPITWRGGVRLICALIKNFNLFPRKTIARTAPLYHMRTVYGGAILGGAGGIHQRASCENWVARTDRFDSGGRARLSESGRARLLQNVCGGGAANQRSSPGRAEGQINECDKTALRGLVQAWSGSGPGAGLGENAY